MQVLMLEISKQFGKIVRETRLKKGLSQGDVAKRLNVYRSYISGFERGVRNPSLGVVERIAKALGVTAKNLIK